MDLTFPRNPFAMLRRRAHPPASPWHGRLRASVVVSRLGADARDRLVLTDLYFVLRRPALLRPDHDVVLGSTVTVVRAVDSGLAGREARDGRRAPAQRGFEREQRQWLQRVEARVHVIGRRQEKALVETIADDVV